MVKSKLSTFDCEAIPATVDTIEPEYVSQMYCCPVCGLVWARIYAQEWWSVYARRCPDHGGGSLVGDYRFEHELESLPPELLIHEILVFKPPGELQGYGETTHE